MDWQADLVVNMRLTRTRSPYGSPALDYRNSCTYRITCIGGHFTQTLISGNPQMSSDGDDGQVISVSVTGFTWQNFELL